MKDKEQWGIYIHIPFCKQSCHYCDFHFSTSLKQKDKMFLALLRELEMRQQEIGNKGYVQTIYFGGGTPSLFSADELTILIDKIDTLFEVSEQPEITIEANPDDLTTPYLQLLSQTKVNRLSIGIQSFIDRDLKLMNRAHNASESITCLSKAKQYFDNISIDLIYGIPGMSDDEWKTNLDRALALNIPHISSYALTVEPETALASYIQKGIIANVDDEQAQRHFTILVDTLENAGYTYYEFSNFGKKGYMSQNNTAYWQGKKYLGIGPSAHSYDGIRRSWNIAHNIKYIQSIREGELPREVEVLSTTDRYNEYVMTGLRTIWGISLSFIEQNFGVRYKEYALLQAKKHIDTHLMYEDEDSLIVTRKGKFLSDGIASDLFLLNLESTNASAS